VLSLLNTSFALGVLTGSVVSAIIAVVCALLYDVAAEWPESR
jgi:hypothetical protein